MREVPEPGRARKIHAALHCYDRLRRHRLELAIIDYYYLAVRTGRTGSLREYVLDLRFIDRSLGLTKHFPRRCVAVTLALAIAAAFSVYRIGSSTVPWWHHRLLPMCAATFVLTACACLVCAWRMTETLTCQHPRTGHAARIYGRPRNAPNGSPVHAQACSAHPARDRGSPIVRGGASSGRDARTLPAEGIRRLVAGTIRGEQSADPRAQHAPGARAR